MNPSRFHQHKHPFLWTTPEERADVLANVNEPIWHRFLEEAERHFQEIGELRPGKFPVFCHDGDLDEVMAVAVLAYVRQEAKYWRWIADWLRGLLAYYRVASPEWRENRQRVMRGEQTHISRITSNPRQYFEGFSQGMMYWVEAGLTSVIVHLLDQLEAYAPDELNDGEKAGLLEAISDYANRYAFHEEAVKYNNRGMWANSGVLLASIAHVDPKAGELLRFQAERRNDEFRSTFFDDGFHAEGAPDYHLMAADALLAYILPASHLEPWRDHSAAKNGAELFQQYPSFVEIVRAYLRTVIPGPTLWNNPRGCSVSTPITVRPALVYAWKLTGDPEIGWFLRTRMEAEALDYPAPLHVTKAALLGLGHYQPLLNFWLYRPVENVRPPTRKRDILPDHGGLFSRSGWDSAASCVTARFGYEGTGKGHRDHAHVTVTTGGVNILKDPFPRYGPKGLETSLFHNTVTLDQAEPAAVLGALQASQSAECADAFLISNAGGALPERIFLHDPREETNYWFTNHPKPPDFDFQRAIFHLHQKCVVIVDRVQADSERIMDWFFHSDLQPAGYSPTDNGRSESYQLQQRTIVTPAETLEVILRGEVIHVNPEERREIALSTPLFQARLGIIPLDVSLQIETGHHAQREIRSVDGISFAGEVDYFLRARALASRAHVAWVISWDADEDNLKIQRTSDDLKIEAPGWEGFVNFAKGTLGLKRI